MLGEFLLSLIGNAAYDAIKLALRSTTAERRKSAWDAFDRAGRRFYERYGDTFGTPGKSFLARDANWNVVAQSIFPSAPLLSAAALDRAGYDDAPPATDEALEFFVRAIVEEMRKDHELDQIITEKERTVAMLGAVRHIADTLGGAREESGPYIVDRSRPQEWRPEKDKIYEIRLRNGGLLRYMLHDDGISIESVLPNGATAYYELDKELNTRKAKLAYPLEEFRLEVDPSLIIGERRTDLGRGVTRIEFELRWNRRLLIVRDAQGRLAHIEASGGTVVDNLNRVIRLPSVEDFDAGR